MQAYWPVYPMNSLRCTKSIVTHILKLQYYGFRAMEICIVIVLYILVKPILIKTMFKSINMCIIVTGGLTFNCHSALGDFLYLKISRQNACVRVTVRVKVSYR